MPIPLIAIARCGRTQDYVESVRLAGGEPLVVDRTTHDAETVVRQAAGILLTGGDDVRPALYGAAAHPAFEAEETGRDEYEIELVARALEADLPILAICRGIQVLNVARGGTLVQDLPTERPSGTRHQFPTTEHPADKLAHTIEVAPDSLLSTILGSRLTDARITDVNSRHHQAVDVLAPGLRVTAVAPDAVVEAVEDPARRFCVGVQWHPESFHRTGEFLPLFEAFVRASQLR
ncbi:MAG: gamma-glutamyl-gamma-aminobutyrate hydrolase family protein [Acidobacteria bacterium]|nr:gamma-glutamyl-gamma-aminobutyrate hydrolase family protein [Acidobacteriota bacterium]